MFCAYTRPRYQVSVYRTIGPLVNIILCIFTLSFLGVITFILSREAFPSSVTVNNDCDKVINNNYSL